MCTQRGGSEYGLFAIASACAIFAGNNHTFHQSIRKLDLVEKEH